METASTGISRKGIPWGALCAGVLWCALALSLVPIFLVGDCAHPFGDDFAYSVYVHYALSDGESVLAALWQTVSDYYTGWQGTYSAAALMALQPALWGEQAYILTAFVMVGALLAGTLCLTHTVLRRGFTLSRSAWLGAAGGILLVTIQLQPDPMQAFYWWNGAVYYTFFFSLMLLYIHFLLCLRLGVRHKRLPLAAALFLAFVLGGGNYVTGLATALAGGAYALGCLIWDRPRWKAAAACEVVLLLGFIVNMAAPGNAVRAASAQGLGPITAIWRSCLQAGADGLEWMGFPMLALLVGMAPLLWKCAGKTSFSFPWPVAVSLGLFLLFAAQNTPHFYALGEAGPGRLRDIVFDSYPWLLLCAEGYWLGWLRRKGLTLGRTAGLITVLAACALALTGLVRSGPWGTTGQCAAALSDGSARRYDAQLTARAALFNAPGDEAVVCTQPDVQPPLLYYFDVTENPENFANIAAANYYRKASVIALPPAQQEEG